MQGEVKAGESFLRPLGNGLSFWMQPVASGWILRVVPSSGARGRYDYAELATPPYDSVTPLSLSTDFAFRAQDAVAWNPRHFRFTPDGASFGRLQATFSEWKAAGDRPSAALQGRLAAEAASLPEGEFQILDARLQPGTANQWQGAAAVASHFSKTAHTVEQPADGTATALGKLISVSFRVSFELPAGFRAAPGLQMVAARCASTP